MNTLNDSIFQDARTKYLAQVAYMHNQNNASAERSGGVERLRAEPTTDAAKRFLGIETRLIQLADYDDAVMRLIDSLSAMLEEQFITIRKQNADIKRLEDKPSFEPVPEMNYRDYLRLMLLATSSPKSISALIDHREGRRQASFIYAQTCQPNLFSPVNTVSNGTI
jgi:hypothetical protein